MLFSSIIFIYAFLPIVIIANFLIKPKYKNGLLLISSLLFFAWGGVSYSILLIFSLLINFTIGLLISKYEGSTKSKILLGIGIFINLLFLGIFKYADFMVENINFLTNFLKWKAIDKPGILLPLGISFYTFQAISYIFDIYRKEALVQRNFLKMALYISFFPQLIAGPIVKYSLIEKQLSHRKNHWGNFSIGIKIFVLGLCKKVLFANQFGLIADEAFLLPNNELGLASAWIGIISYALQIYFDFSGYSDMAIGLGKMFGFSFPENFNFPYISKSIREFWTRWHITLGAWFRDYLYIPLGGNKKGNKRTIINLLIVFFATAIWHGASWNFVIWGMIHGVFMMFERLGLGKLLSRLPKFVQHAYVLFVVLIAWVFFRADTAVEANQYISNLFNFSNLALHPNLILLLKNKLFIIIAFFGILSTTKFWLICEKHIKTIYKLLNTGYLKATFWYGKEVLSTLLILCGLFICTMLLIGDTYNPFIYFRF